MSLIILECTISHLEIPSSLRQFCSDKYIRAMLSNWSQATLELRCYHKGLAAWNVSLRIRADVKAVYCICELLVCKQSWSLSLEIEEAQPCRQGIGACEHPVTKCWLYDYSPVPEETNCSRMCVNFPPPWKMRAGAMSTSNLQGKPKPHAPH